MQYLTNASNPYNDQGESLGKIILEDGSVIYPTQQPYIDGTEEPFYTAQAFSAEEDEDGEPLREYRIRWTCREDYNDIEDSADHCDWDEFQLTIL